MAVKHAFVSALADDAPSVAAGKVVPSNWNADHVVDNYWIDLDFPIIIRSTGQGIPTMGTLRGNVTVPQWQVNDYNQCDGREMPHAYKAGTALHWHVHMITNGTVGADRFVKFEIEWVWALIGGALSNTVTTTMAADYTIPANTADRTHLLVEIEETAMPSLTMGAHLYPRLKRITATGTAPAADPFITMLQAHIICDTFGSSQETTK